MADLFLFGFFMLVGCLIGLKGIGKDVMSSKIGVVQEIIILVLIFVMGVGIGKDEKIVKNIFSLGFKAAVIAILTVTFSVLAVHLFARLRGKHKENKNVNDN